MIKKIFILCLLNLFLHANADSVYAAVKADNQIARYIPEMAHRLGGCLLEVDQGQPSFHGCGGWHQAVAATWALMMYGHITGIETFVPLVSSRLTSKNISREIKRIQSLPNADSPEARGWVLRLYLADRIINNSDRLKPMANLTALYLRTQLKQDLQAGKASFEQYGLAALFMFEYATVNQDPSLQALIRFFVRENKEKCDSDLSRIPCQGLMGRFWLSANGQNIVNGSHSFFSLAIMSEHAYLNGYQVEKKTHESRYLEALNAWLIQNRLDPLANVYGFWAALPFLSSISSSSE